MGKSELQSLYTFQQLLDLGIISKKSENIMNNKYIAYLVLGMVLLGTVATLSLGLVAAQGPDTVEVGSDNYQTQQSAGEKEYRFRAQTRLRIKTSHQLQLNMSVNAMEIGDRGFYLEVESDGDMEMNMTCVRDQEQLGIQNGSLVRNQLRHQVRNNFAARLQINKTEFNARIGMEMSRGDAIRAHWAYFDEDGEEWVEVESSYEDGMLVAETDHFSVWTIVESPSLLGLWIGIGVGVVAIGAIAAIMIRKKRA
ncbi:MAG: hypothetical protein EU530_02270 [Promethearchaeota archaeon]|nr:MAG: hypothetical protein EU530_02270 [Candidatus Lokiarchaeota archaeon]